MKSKFPSSLVVIILLTFVSTLKAQQDTSENFKYSEAGLNDYVVTEVANKSKEDIYTSTLNWIKETYKSPDEVIKMKIENKKVRINGTESKLLTVKKRHQFDLTYVVEIAFKDNKYKFELQSLLANNGKTDYKALPNFTTDKKLLKNFGDSGRRIESYFNGLNKSLKEYIEGEGDEDDDW